MAKYNITENRKKKATHRALVSPELMAEMKVKILNIISVKKMYKDKNYSAKKLAEDLGTNTRYVSAVISAQFNMNYASLVNKFRVEEAMAILTDPKYAKLRMEEVSDMVGFANRQSFYASFYKIAKMPPRSYRLQHQQKQTTPRK